MATAPLRGPLRRPTRSRGALAVMDHAVVGLRLVVVAVAGAVPYHCIMLAVVTLEQVGSVVLALVLSVAGLWARDAVRRGS